MAEFQLAQINVAKAVAEMETEVMHGFVSRLEEINALADQALGFVWRLQSEDGDATSINVFDDALMLINISVWDSLESLKAFVYRTVHVELIQDREAWFNKMGTAHQALWWVPAGHIPSEEEGKEKLAQIREHGPTQDAFTFGRPFPRP
ncbi:MAG: DUF3291 domain-containing protein [Xanthomonadales bacterium]|nr:DUF3291 domain-containing protein [Xanthomonadales bacterium]